MTAPLRGFSGHSGLLDPVSGRHPGPRQPPTVDAATAVVFGHWNTNIVVYRLESTKTDIATVIALLCQYLSKFIKVLPHNQVI